MRETRTGKRISVHGVPLDTSWFRPYCCATVDTFLALPRERPVMTIRFAPALRV